MSMLTNKAVMTSSKLEIKRLNQCTNLLKIKEKDNRTVSNKLFLVYFMLTFLNTAH